MALNTKANGVGCTRSLKTDTIHSKFGPCTQARFFGRGRTTFFHCTWFRMLHCVESREWRRDQRWTPGIFELAGLRLTHSALFRSFLVTGFARLLAVTQPTYRGKTSLFGKRAGGGVRSARASWCPPKGCTPSSARPSAKTWAPLERLCEP